MKQLLVTALVVLSFAYGLGAHFAARHRLNGRRNVLLTLVLISLTIWAGGSAVYLSAPDLSTALLWRRVSALGWGTVFSLLLHLVMQASGHQHLLRKPVAVALLHAPSAAYVFFYVIYRRVANRQYNLVRREGMWINLWVDTPLNWLYTVHYALFLGASLYFLYKWYRNASSKEEARHAGILFVSLAAAMVLSLYLNTVFQNAAVEVVVAQSAVILALVPVLAIVQVMRRQSAMQPEASMPDRQNGHILSTRARTQTYHVAGIALFLLSYMAFYTGSLSIPIFVMSTTRWGNILMGMLLMAAAQLVYSLDRMRFSIKQQENLLLLVFIVVDLFLFIRFASIGAVTSWSSILLIILTGIVFSNIKLVMAGGAVHILFMLATAVMYPDIETSVNVEDHLWRIMIVGAAMALAYVVNRTYLKGLRENEEHARMQRAISDVALLLSKGSLSQYASRTSAAMELAQQYLQPDRLLVLEEAGSQATSTALQLRPLPALTGPEDMVLANELAWLLKDASLVAASSDFCIRVADFPENAAAAQQMLRDAGFHQVMLASLNTPDKARCVALLVREEKRRLGRLLRSHDFVNTFASIMTGYIRRICSEVEMEFLAYYDSLTGVLKRERFMQLSEQHISSAACNGDALGLLFLDLNGFKQVNDQAGHKTGDRVLKEVTSRLLSHTLETDLIGRYGGDEFLVLICRKNGEEIRQAGKALQQAVAHSFEENGETFFVSTALGVALASEGVSSVDRLIDEADAAMYADKVRTKADA